MIIFHNYNNMSREELINQIKDIKDKIRASKEKIILTGLVLVMFLGNISSLDVIPCGELEVIGYGDKPFPSKTTEEYYRLAPKKYKEAVNKYNIVDPSKYLIGLLDDSHYTLLNADGSSTIATLEPTSENSDEYRFITIPVDCVRTVSISDFVSANPQFAKDVYTKSDLIEMVYYAQINNIFDVQVYALNTI